MPRSPPAPPAAADLAVHHQLPDTTARLVEFTLTLTVTDERGRARTTRFRILTTLLDHEHYPAEQIMQVYAER